MTYMINQTGNVNVLIVIISQLMVITFFSTPSHSLSCVFCDRATSNHECNLHGIIQTCVSEQASCFSEIRKHGGVYSIRKGCMQAKSCQVQLNQNNTPTLRPKYLDYTKRCNDGFENSVCHYCCHYNNCNLAEKPTSDGKNRSCTQFFPCCRATWWNERNGFLPESGASLGCHCDSLCEANGDCCHDYDEICVGVLPTQLRSEDPYGGATGGEYNKVMPRGGGLPLLRCFVCDEASSNEECNRIGRIVECQANQRSCITEVRTRNREYRVSKRCEQTTACEALQRSAPTCGSTGVCFSCCDINYCNVFERPHERNLSESCLSRFPGYPQCKRRSLSECRRNIRCAGTRCKCDDECRIYHDCCSDYDELCASAETTNLGWIFREIEREERRRNLNQIASPLPGQPGGEVPRAPFPVFAIMQDTPFELEATPALMREMRREREERVELLMEERRARAEKVPDAELNQREQEAASPT